MHKAVVFVNPKSGLGERPGWREALERLRSRRDWDCLVEDLRPGANLRLAFEQAAEAGFDRVIAAGGDGTIRTAAGALAGTGTPLGVVPMGTLNHFARDLGVPLDPAEALESALSGDEALVDVAQVNRTVFLNNCAMGLFEIPRDTGARHGGFWRLLGMVKSAFSLLRRYPYLQVRVEAEGKVLEQRTALVLVANNGHSDGFQPWFRDRLDQGVLGLYLLRDSGRWGLLRLLVRLVTGTFSAEDEFEVMHASRVRVETKRRRIPISIDGDVTRLSGPFEFFCRQRELRVVRPAAAPEEIAVPVEGVVFAS